MNSKDKFVQIIEDNDAVIYKIVRTYAYSLDRQKDLYQEIVYQLWKSFGSFRGDSKISTWIYRIAMNTSISYLQKGKRMPNTVDLNFDHLNISIPEEANSLEDRMTHLYGYIKKLNLIDRGIILLYLEGNSYEEIGHVMGFTPSRVGTRLSRIKNKLKKKIIT